MLECSHAINVCVYVYVYVYAYVLTSVCSMFDVGLSGLSVI